MCARSDCIAVTSECIAMCELSESIAMLAKANASLPESAPLQRIHRWQGLLAIASLSLYNPATVSLYVSSHCIAGNGC